MNLLQWDEHCAVLLVEEVAHANLVETSRKGLPRTTEGPGVTRLLAWGAFRPGLRPWPAPLHMSP